MVTALRKLLRITLGSPAEMSEPLRLSAAWKVCCATDVRATGRVLRDQPLRVDILLLHQIDAQA